MFGEDRRQASGVDEDDEEYRSKYGPLWHTADDVNGCGTFEWVWNICRRTGHAVSDQRGKTGTMQEQSSLHQR